jgi:hypothetical protein
VIPLHLPPGDTSQERTLQIDGTNEQIESAKQLVNEVISEVCLLMLDCRQEFFLMRRKTHCSYYMCICVSIFFVYLERERNCAFLILGSGFVV